jgi:hypothetical protein
MPKRTSKPKLDTVQNARRVFLEAVGEETTETTVSLTIVQQVMREMGAKGGRIGGKRRLATMTKTERSEVAKKAARARWSKVKKAKKKAT